MKSIRRGRERVRDRERPGPSENQARISVAPPLSAGFIMISLLLLSLLKATRSRLLRLSR